MRIDIPPEHIANPLGYLGENVAPEIVRAGMNFAAVTFKASRLSLREFEAARVRTAQINGCMVCRSFRSARDTPSFMEQLGADPASGVIANGPAPDEAFYEALNSDRLPECLTERELLAIEYADGMGLDPKGIARDEHFWKRMKAAFAQEEIVDLTFCLADWIGLGRMTHVLGLDMVCVSEAAS